MKKFKAKKDGYLYKKGDLLELIQKEYDGCSLYLTEKDEEVYAWDDNLEEIPRIPVKTKGGHRFTIREVVEIAKVRPLGNFATNDKQEGGIKCSG